jgi:short-subunit dehydrogenase
MQNLEGASVVITGASSGIGRAAAVAFARRGALLTLAARRADALDDVAAECRQFGAHPVVAPTDVTDSGQVEALAQAAMDSFGRIDVWINNAGSGVIGAFQEVPLELHKRTIELNLLGSMYGAHAVLPIFLRQRAGTLINNISVAAWAPNPYGSSYTASKFGLRGFTASLRQELAEHPDIHVCGVFPAVIDTPGLLHGANMSGRRINPGSLLYAPEDVAETFVAIAMLPRDEVAVGWPARAAQLSYALARGPTEYVMGWFARRALERADPEPTREGALLDPIAEGVTASGGWRRRKGVPSADKITQAGLACAALMAAALMLARTRRTPRQRSLRR